MFAQFQPKNEIITVLYFVCNLSPLDLRTLDFSLGLTPQRFKEAWRIQRLGTGWWGVVVKLQST